MKKSMINLVLLIVLILTGCSSKTASTEENKKPATIVSSYEQTIPNENEEYFTDGVECVLITYHQMGDGSWKCEDYNYQHRLEISGRLNNAAKDTTYIILSNRTDITFDQAWKASGLSSNMDDYFDPKDAKIVGIILTEPAS